MSGGWLLIKNIKRGGGGGESFFFNYFCSEGHTHNWQWAGEKLRNEKLMDFSNERRLRIERNVNGKF